MARKARCESGERSDRRFSPRPTAGRAPAGKKGPARAVRLGHLGTVVALGGLAIGCEGGGQRGTALVAHAPERVTRAAYDEAAGLLSRNVQGTVRNAEVVPHWIGDRDEFWYERDTERGTEIVIVDAATGARRPAFDRERLAEALSAAAGVGHDPLDLGILALDFDFAGRGTVVRTRSSAAVCDLGAFAFGPEPAPSSPPTGAVVCEALPDFASDPLQLVAPDGSLAAFARSHDVWLRDLEDGAERKLSQDGEEHFGYGAPPGWSARLALLRQGLEAPLTGASWAPDSTKLLISRTDERKVGSYPYLELLAADGAARPRTLEKRVALIGDREIPRFPMFVFDVRTGASRRVPLPEDCFGDLGGTPPQAIWTPDSRRAFFLCLSTDSSRFELIRYDLASGRAESVFEEEADSFLDLNHSLYRSMGANVRVLAGGRRAITFSQRDGWGHLYLVDLEAGVTFRQGEAAEAPARGLATGARQLTRGEWVVHDIVAVDESDGGGFVYFTAGGREPGRNPYWRHVYRAPLEGEAEVELLTPERADHAVTVAAASLIGAASTFAPSGRYFVTNSSTLDSPPVSRLRRSDGAVVATLERADASELFARGYEPPLPFTVEAADGETRIHGVVYRPKNFEEGRKYPVIEHIYGGPQTNVVPRDFTAAAGVSRIGGQSDFSTFSSLGFAVVTIDARGTPWRSKAFHDAMWKKHHEFALEDHVAALEQLGERFPWLDMERVGVTGHSWGGYASALAMLRYPKVYSVAVSSAGPYDYRYLYPSFMKWTGWPEYEDGGRFAPDATARPLNLRPHSALASRLEGKLLIVYGEHDENSLPASTLTLVDALVDANRDFDLLLLPNRDHFFTGEPYFVRRRWDYFARHLLGAEPPADYSLPQQR